MQRQGFLKKMPTERYAINGEYELTSGDVVEVWRDDGWQRACVEYSHTEKAYYLTDGSPIDWAMVRLPE
jgi:hypothetical protein